MNNIFRCLSLIFTVSFLVLSNSSLAANNNHPTGWYYVAWNTAVSPTVYMKIGNFSSANSGDNPIDGYNSCQRARIEEYFDNDTITSSSTCALSNWGPDIISYKEELETINIFVDEVNTVNENYNIAEYQEKIQEIRARIFGSEER